MSWYAIEELENALEETKDLLFPIDRGTWVRLIVIVVLTGQGFSIPNIPADTGEFDAERSGFETTYGASSPTDMSLSDMAVSTPELPATGMSMATATAPSDAVIAVLVALIVLGGLLFLLVSSIFEFIYYQSLLDKDVRIIRNFREHLGKGARYFGFRIGIGIIALLLLAGAGALLALNTFVGVFALFILLLGALPLIVLLALTHNFVLLKMIETESGVLPAWRDFWPELQADWKEVLVYLLVRLGINIVFGIAAVIWALLTLILLTVPFGIVTALLYMVAPVMAVLPALIGVITWLVLLLGLQVVLQTYLYNYAILVYHDLTA